VKLLDSLLDAIVRLEGDALVMHVGEKPYVVTASSSMNAYRGPLAWGQVELSSRVLTFDAVSSMLVQILPVHQQQALTEFGAIEHEIPSPSGVADRFTVIAARGGEDVWLEVRRRPIELPQETSEARHEPEAAAESVAAAPASASDPAAAAVSAEPVAADAQGVDEFPAAAPGQAPSDTGATPEVDLVPEQESEIVEPAAAEVHPDAVESIVVAIPGQAAEEFQLDAVPDNAIQVIDEEPQGVPTEEEVDAMLGATAAALQAPGIDDEEGANVEGFDLQEPANGDELEEAATVLTRETETGAGVVEPSIAEPAFELSPPPPLGAVDDEAPEDAAVTAEAPAGTPLFSDEAVLAAAAAPHAEGSLVKEAPVENAAVDEAALIAEAVAAEPMVAVAEASVAPPQVPESASVGEMWPPVDHAAIVETWPAAAETPIAETWPAAETPLAETWPAAAEAPIAEMWSVADETPIVERWAALDQPTTAETWPIDDQASSVEVWPVDDQAPLATVEPTPGDEISAAEAVAPAEHAPVAEAGERGIAEPSFEAALVHVDVRGAEPSSGHVAAHRPEEMPPAVDGTPAESEVVSTLTAGAEQAVSEPTPQVWTPPAVEIPMEVTPELHRHEAVAAAAETAAPEASSSFVMPEPAPREAAVQSEDETRQAVVVPLARSPIKPEFASVPFTPSEDAALMHTLRVAAARGASTVYVVAQSKPMVRIDGEIGPLESEPILTAADVDRLVMELAPPRRRDALQNGPVEWLCDVPEIGRVRCQTFRDHRGPGILFRMFPPRAISADQLGLTPEVQALCQQSDGLVLVTGARASGKSTLLNAFVDLINRTRSDHLITIESQIGFVHESRRSFISQRESRGDVELAATYARAALREDPDVMMIEDLKSADLVSAALEAAESGRLVLASVPASSTIGALERLIEVFPADRRAKARTSLATALRGVVAQVLLRRVKGGRVAAREILLNTPAVSTLVLEGKMFQLPVALDSGRRHGMVPLTDSLAAQVRDGTVHVAEAYRKALDREGLVALLKREGIDTSFAERLA
jgi:twitching motility protein PilT